MRPAEYIAGIRTVSMTTHWKCLTCGNGGKFTHGGLEGSDLVQEVRIRHSMANLSCPFWDTRIRMRTEK